MGSTKRRKQRKQLAHGQGGASKQSVQQDTIRLINQAVEQNDDVFLRKLAAVRGLVNSELRSWLWPRLLGASPATPLLPEGYGEHAAAPHRDSSTVRCDVARSLWSFTRGWTDEERDSKREELQRLLNAVVNASEGSIHYYQGLHDVAGVLLLTVGEARAFGLLSTLAAGHLRDATRPALDAVIELLQLLQPILEVADPEVASALRRAALPPFFALSWFITWFAHDLDDLGAVARLFDLFLASHPLMPLYVGAVAMRSQRTVLLAAEEMPELHSALVTLRVTAALTPDELAFQGLALYTQLPPLAIITRRRLRLSQCVAPLADKQPSGGWRVPPLVNTPAYNWPRARLDALMQAVMRVAGGRHRKGLLLLSIVTLNVCALCAMYAATARMY